jgi:hypothetical protein
MILLVALASLSAFAFIASQASILITTDINEVNSNWMKLMSVSPSEEAAGSKGPATLDLLMQQEQIETRIRSIYEKAKVLRIADPATWDETLQRPDPVGPLGPPEQGNPHPGAVSGPSPEQPGGSQVVSALTSPQIRAEADKYYHDHARTRYFGQKLVDDVTLYNGVLTNCVLPILYALFGACAYQLVGTFAAIRDRRFVRSRTYFGRYALAGIAGEVIGLFNFAIAQPASVSPLAMAFLVGYGADAFFTLLQTIIANLTVNSSGAPTLQGHRAPPPAPLSPAGNEGAAGSSNRGFGQTATANLGPATAPPLAGRAGQDRIAARPSGSGLPRSLPRRALENPL